MGARVVAFGEIMLRLSTPGFARFVQAGSFDACYGGGEANVAVALAGFGLNAALLTKLPEHEIGQGALNALRRFGVDTSLIVRGGERVGVYYLETGASQRPGKVIYDRVGSAITGLTPDQIDADAIMQGADWFHFTGITPALGAEPKRTLAVLLKAARNHSVRVSADLNYRRRLWTPDEARACMIPLMEFVSVCIANEEDAQMCLGMTASGSDADAGVIDEGAYADLARRMKERFGFDAVAITLRESVSATRNMWSAVMIDDRACSGGVRSRRYDVTLVDRVGGGDAFAAGLIYGLLELADTRRALEFASAAGCLKQTMPGDFCLASVEEVAKLARGAGTGRIER